MAIPNFISSPNPEIFLSKNFLTLDFETTNINKGSALTPENSLILSCYQVGDDYEHQYVCEEDEYYQGELVDAIDRADFLVAHNAKFELQWLQRIGIDISKVLVFDTMIAEYIINGNIKVPLSLGAVADRYGFGTKEPYVDLAMKGGICPSTLPRTLLIDRVVSDVRLTYEIFWLQLRDLQDKGLLNTFFTRCLLTPVLADIERNGVCLDCNRVEEEYLDATVKLISISEQLKDFTGGINLRSTKQLGSYIYEDLKFNELSYKDGSPRRTETGNYKTDAQTIGKLRARTSRQRQFLELKAQHSKLNALLSKNLVYFMKICEDYDGIFRFQFNQAITSTGRLSSSALDKVVIPNEKGKPKLRGVQGQNLPRKLKKLFKPRFEGWKIREDDGEQLEFRVAGYLGSDHNISTDAMERNDIHQFTADTLTAAGEYTNRQDAKSRTFKPLYGGQTGTTAEKEYFQAFREKYHKLSAIQEGWTDTVLKDKQLVMPTGHIFYWPDTTLTESGYITNTASIYNYPVQYLATAEIIPIGLIKAWHEFKDRDLESFIVNTIHDSIITELYPPEEEEVNDIITKSMTEYVYKYLEEVYGIQWSIPLDVGTKIGDHWSEGKETKYRSDPPYELE